MEGEEGEAPFLSGIAGDERTTVEGHKTSRKRLLSGFHGVNSVLLSSASSQIRQGGSDISLVDMIDE